MHPKHPRPSIESLIHFTTSLSPSSRRQRARVSTDHEHQAMSNTHRSCWRFSPSLLPTSPHPRGSQTPPVHHALFWRALLLFAPNAARAVEEQLRRGAPIRLGRHIVIQTRRWVERPAGRGRDGVGCGARQRPPGRAQRRRQRATDQRTLRRNRRGERRWIVPRRDGRRGELRGGCVRRLWKRLRLRKRLRRHGWPRLLLLMLLLLLRRRRRRSGRRGWSCGGRAGGRAGHEPRLLRSLAGPHSLLGALIGRLLRGARGRRVAPLRVGFRIASAALPASHSKHRLNVSASYV